MKNLLLCGFLIVALIAADHIWGPLLLDDVYCMGGAGITLPVPSATGTTSWDAATGRSSVYSRTPASSWCYHKTLWTAYRRKLGL